MDIIDTATRRRMMAGIGAKNTKPEILVRKTLFAHGYRFRLHYRHLPGNPDIVFPGRKIVIFVHGCFWHQHAHCRFMQAPKTNFEFWQKKLRGNVDRDARSVETLLASGWRVLIVWECATRGDAISVLGDRLVQWINGSSANGELADVT